MRPLAGAAIAATVALAAIFGLQQNAFITGQADSPAPALAGNAVEETYTVPDASDEMLRELQLIHGRDSLGLDNFGLVSQVRQGQLVEVGAGSADISAAGTDSGDKDNIAESDASASPEAQTP
jgi:hypothetical protein